MAVTKIGILLSGAPSGDGYRHGLGIADAALRRNLDVYVYCIDDAVTGVADPRLQELRSRGAKVYACAYGAQKRGLPTNDLAAYAGLTVVSDLISSTDRFLSFR